MLNGINIANENGKNSKLLALFNALEERDKEIIISMSEKLLEKWKNHKKNTVNYNIAKTAESKHLISKKNEVIGDSY